MTDQFRLLPVTTDYPKLVGNRLEHLILKTLQTNAYNNAIQQCGRRAEVWRVGMCSIPTGHE
ncbi:hypothetical protein EMIT0P176_420029 [Pseudomonas sp. IT-P176]